MKTLQGTISIPGSKSLSNRALLLAALACGTSTLQNFLWCDDTLYMLQALNQCGVHTILKPNGDLQIYGQGGKFAAATNALFLGNSGTSMRFLSAAMALVENDQAIVLLGNKAMQNRPIEDLAHALRSVAVEVSTTNGFPPITVKGPICGGSVQFSHTISSQFISAMLMVGPYATSDLEIGIEQELVSKPYVEMTLKLMQHFGASVTRNSEHCFVVAAGQKYQARHYYVESDFSSASYFFAAVVLCGGSLRFRNMDVTNSLQGDAQILDILRQMNGCVYYQDGTDLVVQSLQKPLRNGSFDLSNCSDMALTLAVVAAYAQGTTELRGIGHIRFKETDRMQAAIQALQGMGIEVQLLAESLLIKGGIPRSARIKTYDDHRMAMAFAIASLRTPGIVLDDPLCCSKTFPTFFLLLEQLLQ